MLRDETSNHSAVSAAACLRVCVGVLLVESLCVTVCVRERRGRVSQREAELEACSRLHAVVMAVRRSVELY